METFIKAPGRFKFTRTLLVVAAAVAALTAVLLATGSGHADGPRHATPEACLTPVATIVQSGHYAVFDVYWDDNENDPTNEATLINNPCPPGATHTATSDGFLETEITIRSASHIDIGQTVFHVPSAAKQPLTASGSGNFDGANYSFLRKVLVTPTPPDSNGNVSVSVADSADVWILPKEIGDLLKLGFSAGLLNPLDWTEDPAPPAGESPAIKYEFNVIREEGISPEDRGFLFVFDHPDDPSTATAPVVPSWDSSDPDRNAHSVLPGKYEHRAFAFTKPGTYWIDVQAKGHPNQTVGANDPISTNRTVTSIARRYTFHVGLMADLHVGIAADDSTPTQHETVEYTITAHNKGPDDATGTIVEVDLPDGLRHSSHDPATDSFTYNSSKGKWEWNIGTLANGATETLYVDAVVSTGERGRNLETTAEIAAYETIGGSTVYELDPRGGDNTASATVTVEARPNSNPIFRIAREVTENVDTTAPVELGDAVSVRDSDDSSHDYSLAGDGANLFTVDDSTGQISVAQDAVIDYECRTSYDLTLRVSDHKDGLGNTDDVIDDEISLLVSVIGEDDPQNDPTVTLTAVANGNTLSGNGDVPARTVVDLRIGDIAGPANGQWQVLWEHKIFDNTDWDDSSVEWTEMGRRTDKAWRIARLWSVDHSSAAKRIYRATVSCDLDDDSVRKYLSGEVRVTWGSSGI